MTTPNNAAQMAAQAELCQNSAANYSRAQLQMFLEQVAGQAATLNEILMMAQCSQEEWERDRLVNAAQVIAQGIGCFADHSTGEGIVGGTGRWVCGPAFEKAGGAV